MSLFFSIFVDNFYTKIGSGALPGLMLNLGLFEIIWGGVFPISSPSGERYPNPFPNRAGQSLPLLNLTCPNISINFIIFNNLSLYKQLFTRKCTRSLKYIVIPSKIFLDWNSLDRIHYSPDRQSGRRAATHHHSRISTTELESEHGWRQLQLTKPIDIKLTATKMERWTMT